MSLPDHLLEDDREEDLTCTGDRNCHCEVCTAQWLDVEADRQYDSQREERGRV